jgi:hypothetical protein
MGEVEGDWEYSVGANGVIIEKYNGNQSSIVIPSVINSLPVKQFGGDVGTSSLLSMFYLNPHKELITSVTIPSSVTKIGDCAFKWLSNLQSIVIPESVTEIGVMAFSRTGLTDIIIPNSVTKIGNDCFNASVNLKSITLSENITEIPVGMFRWCNGLEKINIPPSVTSIGEFAFWGNINLTEINLSLTRIRTIGRNAFAGCLKLNSIIKFPPALIADYSSYGLSGTTELSGMTINDAIQIQQEGQKQVSDNPNNFGLYTATQMQTLAFGDLVLTKNVNGSFTLNYDIQQSTDLQNWTTYQAYALPLTGLPTDKAFVRVKMINSNPNPPPSTAAGSNMN